MKRLAIVAAALAFAAPAISHAAPADPSATAVRVSYADLDLSTARGAETLMHRLQDAALESCGASSFSLVDYQDAVRRSGCYRDSLAAAVAEVNLPSNAVASIAQDRNTP